MSYFKYVLNRIPCEVEKFLFFRTIRSILETPVIQKGKVPFTLLSMVQHQDLLPYLAAVKSFARYINPTQIVVICDPSITNEDRSVLRHHIPQIELRDAATFIHSDIPRGGCWERLFAITEYSREAYVVQLDADTLTIARPIEVEESILSRIGFVLGEERNQSVLTVEQIAEKSAPHAEQLGAHIQHRAEAAMASVGLAQNSKYVRGCAGFTGFQPDVNMREKVLDFSARMQGVFKDQWRSWGTEQVASNFTVANQPGTEVLPFPKYGTPDVCGANDSFIHFIGDKRFTSAMYRMTSIQLIRKLQSLNI